MADDDQNWVSKLKGLVGKEKVDEKTAALAGEQEKKDAAQEQKDQAVARGDKPAETKAADELKQREQGVRDGQAEVTSAKQELEEARAADKLPAFTPEQRRAAGAEEVTIDNIGAPSSSLPTAAGAPQSSGYGGRSLERALTREQQQKLDEDREKANPNFRAEDAARRAQTSKESQPMAVDNEPTTTPPPPENLQSPELQAKLLAAGAALHQHASPEDARRAQAAIALGSKDSAGDKSLGNSPAAGAANEVNQSGQAAAKTVAPEPPATLPSPKPEQP